MISFFSVVVNLILGVVGIIAYFVIRYKLKVYRIPKSVHRHPVTWAVVQKFSPTPGDYETFLESYFNPDGTVKSLVALGPSLGGDPVISICDPDAIKEALTNTTLFPKYSPAYEMIAGVLGMGMVVLEGEQWKHHRRVSTPLFHHHALKLMTRAMTNIAEEMASHLKSLNGAPTTTEFFQRFTMRVIIATTFGEDFDADWMTEHFHRMTGLMNPYAISILTVGKFVTDHVPFGPSSKLRAVQSEIKQVLREKIAERRSQLEKNPIEPDETSDLLTLFLLNSMEDDAIIDEGLTFLFAGSDTTQYLLSWVSYYLCKFPEVQLKLSQESQASLNQDGNFDEISLTKMPYLRNVLRETLRLRPPVVGVNRFMSRDTAVNGSVVPAGTAVDVNFHLAQLDPKNWENPRNFVPERFDGEHRHHPFAYVPFSAGERNCIGQKVAMQEAMLFVATLVKYFEMKSDTLDQVKMVVDPLLKPAYLTIKFLEKHVEA
eukprot:TRINITY_DN8690_c0_g1_i1.p1 TRINITY_DN8690_c0_g1~~TRINITY_DN8690_c0_g1_i1.p1  ORF type:complete len:487 (-),score=144.56 TRINITY_DN8690_c0_g1_i1:15-1475(-)